MKETKADQNLIIYDFFAANGGAEKVTFHLKSIINNAEILVSYSDKRIFNSEIKNLIEFYKPVGVNFFDFLLIFLKFLNYRPTSKPKNIIFSGIYAPLSQKNFKGRKIYYCHTPPKFLFLQNHWLKKFNWLFSPILKFYEREYIRSLKHMDIIFANSKFTKNNLKEHFSINSDVLYPPVDINEFSYADSDDFYLSTGRLEKIKNIETIIEAFKIMKNEKLIVCSGGSLYEKLKLKYKGCKNITFTGWLTENELREYISKCIATIYIPFNEDFGISSVESLASGKPVLGINEAGQKEILSHKKNSFLCERSTLLEDVIEGVKYLSKERCKDMKDICIESSKKFDSSKFNKSFLESIK
jgi:glycosyltransferase involved in cell wall biosynthesis